MIQTIMTAAEKPEIIRPWEDWVAKSLAGRNMATTEKIRRVAMPAREDLDSKDLVMKDILDARQKIGE